MAYRSLLDIVTALGLTAGLKVCLDAGDAASYSGSGQTFADRSGQGNDFNRGSTTGSDTSDPTFNGVAGGQSANEYFSSDGGDYFTLASGGASFAADYHKDNALLTMMALVWWPAGAPGFVFAGDCGSAAQNVGFQWSGNLGQQSLLVGRGGGSFALNKTSSTVVSTAAGAWHFFAVSVDEASSTGGIFFVDGVADTFNPTYTSPSAAASTTPLAIGSRGAGNVPTPNTARVAEILMFDGVALTQAQIQAIFNEAGLRFGLVAGGGGAALSGSGTLIADGAAVIAGVEGASELAGGGKLSAFGSAIALPKERLVGPSLLGGAALGTLPIGAIDTGTDAPAEADPFDAIGDQMAQDLIHLVYMELVTPVD